MSFSWPNFFQLILPPFLAAFLSGYLVSRWKSREDAIEKRLDELVASVDEVSKAAVAYWQLLSTDPALPLSAVKVTAGFARLDGLRSAVSSMMSNSANQEIANSSSHLFREATGGDFGVHNRLPDIQRLTRIVHSAAALCVAIRRARVEDLRGWRTRR